MLFTLARKYKRVSTLLRSRESQIYSAHPVERLLRILEALSFWYARLYWFVKYLTIFLPSSKFVTLCPSQGIFALQKCLAGGLQWGTGDLIAENAAPPRKEISRGNLLCAESGLPSLSYPSTREYSKVREHARFVTLSVPGSPGSQRGRAPQFPKESRGNHSQGFPLGNFFAAARHRASLRS